MSDLDYVLDRQGYRFYPSHRGISLIANSDHLTKYVLSNLHDDQSATILYPLYFGYPLHCLGCYKCFLSLPTSRATTTHQLSLEQWIKILPLIVANAVIQSLTQATCRVPSKSNLMFIDVTGLDPAPTSDNEVVLSLLNYTSTRRSYL